MRKIILFIICCIFLTNVKALELNSNYAYVYNVKEDKVMYELDSRKEVPIASLTKIMTAIIVIENNDDLNKEITMINSDFRDMYEYAIAGFNPYDKLTIKDLLYGILLPSGSDAVNAAVRITTSSEEDFVKLMNDKVRELGLNNTYFSNPIGKDEGNYSSMYDVSKILEYALKNEIFKEVFTTATYIINNHVLKGPLAMTKDTSLIMGAKTGFTYDAMYCLGSFSKEKDFDYIVITSYADSYKDVVNDHEKIYEYYFNNYGYKNYNVNFNIKIKQGKEDFYNVNIDTSLYLENSYNKDLLIYEYNGIEEINKDIKTGEKLGLVSIYYKNELLEEINVYLEKEIEYKNYLWLVIFISNIVFLSIILLGKKKKR